MKTSNILTFGSLTVIGASVFYYFKKNKLKLVNNIQIEKKIDEAVKEIASINQMTNDKKEEVILQQQIVKKEADSKEAEDYIAKTLLIDKLIKLKNIQSRSFSKMTPQQRKELFDTVENSSKSPILTQIRVVENTLKDKYGIYPDSQGNYIV